jgi:heme A synthase
MNKFRGLAAVTVVAVYLQVILGSIVRITGSGLGCRDWPLCYQHETDRFAYRTLLEVAHRLLGTAGGLLVLATAVTAFLLHRRSRSTGDFPRGLWLAAAAALGLYAFQGILGGVTVLMKNSPFTVAMHLGNAELVLGMGILVAVWAAGLFGGPAVDSTGGRLSVLLGGIIGAYVIVVTGAVVVGTGASGACTSWPLCGGAGRLADTHMLHRVVVLLGSVAILLAARSGARRWRGRGLAMAAYATVALLVAEVLVGAAQVLGGLPSALRSVHVALASAVWAGTVMLAAGGWLERRPDRVPGAPARTRLAAAEANS